MQSLPILLSSRGDVPTHLLDRPSAHRLRCYCNERIEVRQRFIVYRDPETIKLSCSVCQARLESWVKFWQNESRLGPPTRKE